MLAPGKKLAVFFIVLLVSLSSFSFVKAGALDIQAPWDLQFDSVTGFFEKALNIIWAIFAFIAVVMFIWAGIKFITAQGEPEELKTARRFFIWGIVGVIVAVLAFSIVQIVLDTVQGNNQLPEGAACTKNEQCISGGCIINPGEQSGICSAPNP